MESGLQDINSMVLVMRSFQQTTPIVALQGHYITFLFLKQRCNVMMLWIKSRAGKSIKTLLMMKRLYKNSTLFLAFLGIMLTFSCQKVEYRDRHEGNEISDVYATYENRGRDRLFEGRIVGDTIFIDIDFYHPIDSDNEVDLSKLLIRATVPSDAKISPSLADFWDLTSPRTLTGTAGTGDAKAYIVKANKQGNTDVSRAVLTYEDESGSLQEVDAIILGDKINFSLVPGTV